MLAGLNATETPFRTSRHHASVGPDTRSGWPSLLIICAATAVRTHVLRWAALRRPIGSIAIRHVAGDSGHAM